MFSIFDRFNRWYDSLAEAPRFIGFMVAMTLAVFPLQLGVSLQHRPSIVFGLLVFTAMTLLGVSRAGPSGL